MTARHIRILLMTAAFAAGLVLCFGIVLIVICILGRTWS